jgi:phage terminase large subunit-like protein
MPIASGESQSGPRPSYVAGDEIHELKSESALLTWKAAIDKVAGNALMLLGTNTPARSSQHVGTSYSDMYQQIVKGEARDDTAFAFIARIDKGDRETIFDNERAWQKSLPALGETFPIENIRETVNSAKLRPSTKSSVKRLYFGIDSAAADFWISEEKWSAVQGVVDVRAMRDRKCWLSLDLSQKNDLTALSGAWEMPELLAVKTWYWTTKEGLEERADADKAPYVDWVEDGYLTATPGATIDYTYVAQQVAEIDAEHDIQALVVDPAFLTAFTDACDQIGLQWWLWDGPGKPEGRGLKIIRHAQGQRIVFEERQLCMPHSITRTEDRILEAKILIDASPVTYSCAANAVVEADGMGNRMFNKKRSRGRIDGMVTIAMVTGAATATEKPKKKSVYASRGVRKL